MPNEVRRQGRSAALRAAEAIRAFASVGLFNVGTKKKNAPAMSVATSSAMIPRRMIPSSRTLSLASFIELSP